MVHAFPVRKSIYRGSDDDAVTLFSRSPFIHLAGIGEQGEPVLRVVHGVVFDGQLCFHAANAGEKLGLVDRTVVAMTQQIVAEIPSYFFDPDSACPATTYYRSAQVRGRLRRIDDMDRKAKIMQALMERYQPEGGHVPIVADDPRYAAIVKGLLIAGIDLRDAVAKTKLGQNRRPKVLVNVMEALWTRGRVEDPATIEALRAANPKVPTPEFLCGPDSTTLRVALGPGDAEAAARLLHGSYWTLGVGLDALACAQNQATAWVGAHDCNGNLVATARAVSDRIAHAWIADVVVAPSHRGRGIGRAVLGLLLEHPAVRGVRRAILRTRDAQPLYRTLGFQDSPHTTEFTTMVRDRHRPASASTFPPSRPPSRSPLPSAP